VAKVRSGEWKKKLEITDFKRQAKGKTSLKSQLSISRTWSNQ